MYIRTLRERVCVVVSTSSFLYISVLVRRADLQDLQDHFFENMPLTCDDEPNFVIFGFYFAWIKGGSAGSKWAVLD